MIDNYFYAIRMAYDEFVLAIEKSLVLANKNPFNEEVNFRLCSLIHTGMDCWERIFRANILIDKSDAEFISSFRRVNNLIKHDERFLLFHDRICTFEFPIEFPCTFGEPSLVWGEIPLTPQELSRKRGPELVFCYKKHLSGEPLKGTCEKMVSIVDKYMGIFENIQ